MAGLGAAAGAFEGDNVRAERALKNKQLNMQQDQFNATQARMAKENDRQQGNIERGEAENNWRFDASRRDAKKERDTNRFMDATKFDLNRQDQEVDRTIRADQFNAGERRAQRQEGRAARSDEWTDLLNTQAARNKELEYEANNLAYNEAQKRQTLLDEQQANKQKLAQSVTGVLIRAMAESPHKVLPPAFIEWAKEQDPDTFGRLSGGGRGEPGEPAFLSFKNDDGSDAAETISPEMFSSVMETHYGKEYADRYHKRDSEERTFTNRKEIAAIPRTGTGKQTSEIDSLKKEMDALKIAKDSVGDEETLEIINNRMAAIGKYLAGASGSSSGGPSKGDPIPVEYKVKAAKARAEAMKEKDPSKRQAIYDNLMRKP